MLATIKTDFRLCISMFHSQCSLLSSEAHIVTFCWNSDISNPTSLTNWDGPNQRWFFPVPSLSGRSQCNRFSYTLCSSLCYDSNVIFMCLAMQTISSRKQSWTSSLWLLEEETRTNENPPSRLGLTKRKTISPITANLKPESKWPCKFLQVTPKLEA